MTLLKKINLFALFSLRPLIVFPLEMVRARHHSPNGKAHAVMVLGTHVGVDVAVTGHVFLCLIQGTYKSWTHLRSSFHPFPLVSVVEAWVGSLRSVETEQAAAERGF